MSKSPSRKFSEMVSNNLKRMSRTDKEIVDRNQEKIVDAFKLMPDQIADQLCVKNIFRESTHMELVHQQDTSKRKALTIVKILKTIDDGRSGLKIALEEAGVPSVYDDMFTTRTEDNQSLEPVGIQQFPVTDDDEDIHTEIDHKTSLVPDRITPCKKDSRIRSCIRHFGEWRSRVGCGSCCADSEDMYTEMVSLRYRRTESDEMEYPNVLQFIDELSIWCRESYISDSGQIKNGMRTVPEIYVTPDSTNLSALEKLHVEPKEVLRRLRVDPIKNGRIAVITGDAGMGKTTVIKMLCNDWAIEQSEASIFKLVLPLPLRYVGRANSQSSILEAALQFYETRPGKWFPSLTDKGTIVQLGQFCDKYAQDILFLLDGYDEYGGANTQIDAIGHRHEFDPNFRSVLIVTIRPTTELGISVGRYHYRLDGFTSEHVERFVKNHVVMAADAEKLIKQLQEDERLQLSKTPLLLKMMCEIWEHMPADGSQLPSSKRNLYLQFVNHLIDNAITDGRLTMDKGQVLEELRHVGKICYEELMTKAVGNLIISAARVEPYLDHLQQIGLICSENPYSIDQALDQYVVFKHKSFQEYLAAVYVETDLENQLLGYEPPRTYGEEIRKISNISSFIDDDEIITKIGLMTILLDYDYIKDPAYWCACARAYTTDSIHICPTNSGFTSYQPTMKIKRVIICNIDSSTLNLLKGNLNDNKLDSFCKVTINALNMDGNDEVFSSINSILSELNQVQGRYWFECSLFMPPNDDQSCNELVALNVPEYCGMSYYVHGSTSVPISIGLSYVNLLASIHKLELYNVGLQVDDVIVMIKASEWYPKMEHLNLRCTGLKNHDFEKMSKNCKQHGSLHLLIQPDQPSDLTDDCVINIIQLMINTSRRRNQAFIGLCGLNNFINNKSLFDSLFKAVQEASTKYDNPTKLRRIMIDLSNCGLKDNDCDIIQLYLMQLKCDSVNLTLYSNNISKDKLKLMKEAVDQNLLIFPSI